MNTASLINIYKINLKVKKHEKVLIFTDLLRQDETVSESERQRRNSLREIAQTLKEIGKDLCKVLYAEYPSLGSHGIEPPEEIWQIAFGKKAIQLLKKANLFEKILLKNISIQELTKLKEIIKNCASDSVNAVIALSNFSTSHTNFRDLLTKVCGARYASMPLFDPSMLEGAMNADWKEIQKRGIKLKQFFNNALKIKITTSNTTDITMLKGKRKLYIDSGILTKKGSFGNLPAGELFLAPIEGSADGRLVLEWAPTRKLTSELILNIEKGKVVSIEGEEPYKIELEKKLNEKTENRNIAEVGIGLNEKASKPDNILESEKILGTVHIALGDNSSFGGKVRTPFHQDFVFFEPTVYLTQIDGKEIKIIEKGVILL